jgi:hypothetical protein
MTRATPQSTTLSGHLHDGGIDDLTAAGDIAIREILVAIREILVAIREIWSTFARYWSKLSISRSMMPA